MSPLSFLKRASSTLAVAALCAGSTFASAPSAVLNARASAVQIFQAGKGAEHAICSGSVVMLKEGPRIVSAGHCVVDKDGHAETASYAMLDAYGRVWPLRLERHAFNWPTEDYAVFNSAGEYLLPALKVAKTAPGIGDDIYSWSGPQGINVMLFHGTITGKLGFATDPEADAALHGMVYSADLLTDHGASGSVVINARGEAIYTLVGGFDPKIKLGGAFFSPLAK